MNKNNFLQFPSDFLWGSATSSYQVEGGIDNADWSKFKDAGDACGHYNRYSQDIDLMKEINLNSYRFSTEWSRAEPKPGEFEQDTINHYRDKLQELKNRGVTTMVTLHHFTTPLWLDEMGNWINTKSATYFSRYALKMFEELDDLVDFWITINEPGIYSFNSYLQGVWPPQKESVFDVMKVTMNQIKAHRKVYELFHEQSKKVKVGLAKNNQYIEPYSNSILDKLSTKFVDYLTNSLFLDRVESQLDFIGLNYYFHNKIKFPLEIKNDNKVTTDLGWEVYPKGIYHVLKQLKKYDIPIYITENGLADKKDELRKEFIKQHLYWINKAIQENVDVRGYFHWSLLDNFEWAEGYEPRFGLAEVDYETQERILRDSAKEYAKIAKNNGFKYK